MSGYDQAVEKRNFALVENVRNRFPGWRAKWIANQEGRQPFVVYGAIDDAYSSGDVDYSRVVLGTRTIGETSATPAGPRQHQAGVFAAIAGNAAGYNWIVGGGAAKPIDDPNYYPGYATLGTAHRHVFGETGSAPVGAIIGRIMSPADGLAHSASRWGGNYEGGARRSAFSAWLNEQGYPVWTFPMYRNDGLLPDAAQCQIVIDDYNEVLSTGTIEKLRQYVSGGGSLLLFGRTGRLTMGETASYGCLEALGWKSPSLEVVPDRGVAANAMVTGLHPLSGIRLDSLVRVGAQLPEHAVVLGVFRDGSPAVISWPYGHGLVYWMAGFIANNDLELHAKDLLLALAGAPSITGMDHVRAAIRRRNGDYYVVVMNELDYSRRIDLGLPGLPAAMYEAFDCVNNADRGVTGLSRGLNLLLGPYEISVVRLRPMVGGVAERSVELCEHAQIFPSGCFRAEVLRGLSRASCELVDRACVPGLPGNVRALSIPPQGTQFAVPAIAGACDIEVGLIPGPQSSALELTAGDGRCVIGLGVSEMPPGSAGICTYRASLASLSSGLLDVRALAPERGFLVYLRVTPRSYPDLRWHILGHKGGMPGDWKNLLQADIPRDDKSRVMVPDHGSYCDLRVATGELGGVALSACRIRSKGHARLTVLLGADYGLSATLNGQQVYTSPDAHPHKADSATVQLDLEPGISTIELKCSSGGAGWGFWFKALMMDGVEFLE